ncbi:hypothetical protein GcM3_103011 [Golovinomyces cichoracearum]|uniref:Uncharacterized protein n=1 Tax=Golovinomyces cichoracearum TaxID=62708 RepID=A0A420IA30_9PEZI|nr:hypothetical protein GcM3_103011 [Golovinomyces cichoracearum]
MNEASRIVSELQRNLAELDQKVKLYRRDMTLEFEKYTENLLQNVPSDVSEAVTRTMTESRKEYPLLYPDDAMVNYSYSSVNCSRKEKLEPEPYTLRRSQTDLCKKPDPQNLNEHEVELQGLFTPTYLPLLDHSSRERRSVFPRSPAKSYVDNGSGSTGDFMQADASTEVTRSLTPSPSPTPDIRTPKLKRRLTDGTSSISSSSDRGTRRRSALRLSPVSPKTENESPRRVRFDVAGKEVLPTISPSQTIQLLFDDISSTTLDLDDNNESETFDDTPESARPNRISSSQALRLLSRKSPEDDGTIWTTVCSISEESSPTVDHIRDDRPKERNLEYSPPRALSLNQIVLRKPERDDNIPIDENLLYSPPQNNRTISQTQGLRSNVSLELLGEKSVEYPDEDGEEIFDFEETAIDPQRHQRNTYQIDSEEEEDEFLTIRSSKSKSNQKNSSIQSKSSALKISMSPTVTSGTTNLFESEGSLPKYHPFSIPVVRPEVHAQAARLGPLDTFVGSVDGRTGIDESKVENFRGSVGSPERNLMEKLRSGRSPKSLTERMLLEDLTEEDWAKNCMINHAGDDGLNDSLEVGLSGGILSQSYST